MKKKLIGVMPLWDEQKDSLWMLPGYMDGISRAGGLPLMLPLTADESAAQELAGLCGGFLFTGGQDISPSHYGAEVLSFCGPACEARDAMEKILFSTAVLKLNKPALGICRGIQLFNVLLGGTLYQDIPAQLAQSRVTHQQKPPYDRPVHQVTVERESPLHELMGADVLAVNSSHHQGIAELSPRLVSMAKAEDGLIEAVYMKDRPFVWAVQWHPEVLAQEESSRKIFGAFVDACRGL
ncbi:MAG: gamma-glutamyl-gamma-aminobutyrate hydrolase family protein [Treponema sp.]|jgi:putative glutamine amidotransferase|nr:gamma-glutamyl-gamma-aminobutyrate hydrolase family protein [Treponema sp.]